MTNTSNDPTPPLPAGSAFTAAPDAGQSRRKYKVIRNDQLLLPLPVRPGALVVPKWDKAHEVPGWELTASEIDVHHESLLWGQVLYTRTIDGRTVRVGVRWNPHQFGLEAQCLDGTHLTDGAAVPLENMDGIDTDALEVSTLRRAQRIIELNSFIGAVVADPAAQDVITQSAGLGQQQSPAPENWSVAEDTSTHHSDTGNADA